LKPLFIVFLILLFLGLFDQFQFTFGAIQCYEPVGRFKIIILYCVCNTDP